MTDPIYKLVEELPESSLTTRLLGAIDTIVPGEWNNIVKFDALIRDVTGEDDDALIQQIGARALALYEDPNTSYQTAVRAFKLVDSQATAAGFFTLTSKLGESVGFLSFLEKVTPKPETSQAIDAGLKFAVELISFCACNGLPGDSIGDFAAALGEYAKSDRIRFASWVACDCMLPLGPEFMTKIGDTVRNATSGLLEGNSLFAKVAEYLPGGSTADKKDLITRNLDQAGAYVNGFVAEKGLSQQGIWDKVKGSLEFAEGKLDVAAALLDVTTNPFEHTGIQSVARRVISRAYAEI